MPRFALPLAVLVSCLGLPAWAQNVVPERDPAAPPPLIDASQAEEPAAGQEPPAAKELPAPDEISPENSWRFRNYNGRVWYWTPENHWAVRVDDQWVDYEEGMFRRGGKYYAPPRAIVPGSRFGEQRYYSSPHAATPFSVTDYNGSIFANGAYAPFGMGPVSNRERGFYNPPTEFYYSPGYPGYGYYRRGGLQVPGGPGVRGSGF